MNTVLYTKYFEPITIVDVPIEYIKSAAESSCTFWLEVRYPPSYQNTPNCVVDPLFVAVEIYVEKLVWYGQVRYILVTPTDEAAKLLKPDWSPQQCSINQMNRDTDNLSAALTRAMSCML